MDIVILADVITDGIHAAAESIYGELLEEKFQESLMEVLLGEDLEPFVSQGNVCQPESSQSSQAKLKLIPDIDFGPEGEAGCPVF